MLPTQNELSSLLTTNLPLEKLFASLSTKFRDYFAVNPNELQSALYFFLPEFCGFLFGTRAKRGLFQRDISSASHNAVVDFLRPDGAFIRALMTCSASNSESLLYCMNVDRLPVRG